MTETCPLGRKESNQTSFNSMTINIFSQFCLRFISHWNFMCHGALVYLKQFCIIP